MFFYLIQDVCEQKMQHGDCRGYFKNWFYDHKDRKCKRFVYTGCGGTGNNFQTRNECLKKCGSHSHSRLNLPKADNFQLTFEDSFEERPPRQRPFNEIQYFTQHPGTLGIL